MPKSPEILLTASRFRVERVTTKLADGSSHTREVVRHPGAVVVLPMVSSSEVCLIRNWRIAVNDWLIELPAGTLEPNEPPIHTAGRELIEETGYTAGKIAPLATFFLSPGIMDERMHAFVATELIAGDPAREPGEEMENMVVPWEEALEMACDGRIQDAKTIAALFMYDRIRG